MRHLVICLALILCGCTARPQPTEIVSVSPVSLVRTYRDSRQLADDTWLNRPVRCTVPAGTYTVTDRTLCYQTGMANTAPCIVFEFDTPPPTTGDIVIVGTCRGIIRDGHRRGQGVDFCVRVSDCSTAR